MAKVTVWFYYGINNLLNTMTSGVATSKEEAERLGGEWCDKYKVDSKELDFPLEKEI